MLSFLFSCRSNSATSDFSDSGILHERISKPSLLPIRSLNEIFIGESLSSRYLGHPKWCTWTANMVDVYLYLCCDHHQSPVYHPLVLIPPAVVRAKSMSVTGWSHNPTLIFCFTGLPTTRSLWMMALGKSRRIPDSVFAQERDLKPGKCNPALTWDV